MKSIIISGGSGYIGRVLSQRLIAMGFEVHWVTRGNIKPLPQVELHQYQKPQDIHKILPAKQFYGIIHLAAKATWDSRDTEDHLQSNFELGTHLLQFAADHKTSRFINTTTYWEDSDVNGQPICLYAALKKSFRTVLDFYSREYSMKTLSLRLFDVYGPNDERKKIFNVIQESVDRKEKQLPLTAGEQIIYWTHVDDVVAAYLQAIEKLDKQTPGDSEVFDVRGQPMSLKEAIRKFVEDKALKIELNWGALPYRKNQIMNPVLGELLPNWQAKYTEIKL